jgi:hypothetical protein
MGRPINLEELRRTAQALVDRQQRAAARLARQDTPCLCLALQGFKTGSEHFQWSDGLIELRKVEEPPGEVALAAALKQRALFGIVGNYTASLEWELALDRSQGLSDTVLMQVAWWLVSGIRIRSLADFLVPVVADHSWSTIAAIHDGSVNTNFLEQAPDASLPTHRVVTEDQLRWVGEHLLSIGELMADERFNLAVDSFNIHRHQSRLRIAATTLWTGIEALFPVKQELRFRLSLYVAAFLEESREERHHLFRRVRSYYDFRSKIVHGAKINDTELILHVDKVRDLLASILNAIIEQRTIPTQDDLDALLFA